MGSSIFSRRFVARAAAAVLAGGTLAAVLAGCGGDKYTQPFQDAQRSGVVNSDKVDIITDADGFSNAATKCDHGNRLYFLYHGDSPYGAVAVVAQDPTCKK